MYSAHVQMIICEMSIHEQLQWRTSVVTTTPTSLNYYRKSKYRHFFSARRDGESEDLSALLHLNILSINNGVKYSKVIKKWEQ